MKYKFFITGTDTNIGKTYVSVGLLKKFKELGFSTVGLKPIATGGFYIENKIYNEDALLLQNNSSIVLDYNKVNPYCMLPAISPNIAAKQYNINLTVENIAKKIEYNSDVCIMEGAGGWHTPLNEKETLADLVMRLKLETILVVGIKLGCLNHAILTYKAILSSGIKLKGWIGNCIDQNTDATNEIIETLKNYLNVPCLGIIGYNQLPEEKIGISSLLSIKS